MKRISVICYFQLLLLITACSPSTSINDNSGGVASADNSVVFNWFEYQGNDEVFTPALPANKFQNPIVAGFYPDPSITRKGDDYYMVTSSFSYAPGVPVLHSRDLVNWQHIGHAISPEQKLDFNGLSVSRGIFAPTIRYHNGLFYIITTAVDSGGNFFITAADPAGEWSEPYWLPEIGGIDPDIFFDDDGKVYIAHNDAPVEAPLYQGHRAIWLWEYDLAAKKVIKSTGRVIVNGGTDLASEPIWIEAPHLYKINGWYYLLCAEGGTGPQHSEVVFRTRSLSKPFVPYANNPILTQRDLASDRENPITTAGHADLIQTPTGEWWSVFLATRSYDEAFYNTGRETFLLPVTWQDEWPHILEAGESIPYQVTKPITSVVNYPITEVNTLTGNFTWRDEFEQPTLSPYWSMLRSFFHDWYQLKDGQISLIPSATKMTDNKQPAFLGRRQQHSRYQASTALQFPDVEHAAIGQESAGQVSAGLVAFQNEKFHYYLGVRKAPLSKLTNRYQVFVEQVNDGVITKVRSDIITANAKQQLILAINGDKGAISFSYQLPEQDTVILADKLDGRLLSTTIAGGFVGSMLGIHSRIEVKAE